MAWLLWLGLAGGTLDALSALSSPSGTEAGMPTDTLHLLLQQADAEFADNVYPAAFADYRQALGRMRHLPAGHAAAEAYSQVYLRLGQSCYFMGKYAEGIHYLYELLEEHAPDTVRKAESYILLGNLYLRLQKDSTALRHLAEAREHLDAASPRMNDSIEAELYCDLYICYSSVHLQKGDYPAAQAYLNRAKQYCGTHSRHLGRIYQNEALLHMAEGDDPGAESFYRKAIALTDEPYAKAVLLNNLAVFYLQHARYDEALSLLYRNVREAAAIDAAHVLGNTYYIYSQVYAQTGDYRRAYDYSLKYRTVADSIFDAESEERVLLQNIRYETLRLANEKELVEYRLKVTELENFKKNALIAVLILVVAVAAALIVLAVQKAARQKRRNRLLKEQLQTIGKEKDDMLRTSREQYEAELDSKTRKLTANVMYTAEMRDAARLVLKDVDKLRPICTNPEAAPLLDDIHNHMRPLAVDEFGWDDFDLYFGQTHPAFFTELHKVFPGLTPMENRLCAFIVLNLSTKEIASLTNRSVRTVETMKFRLRKKLGLDRDTSLLAFLQRFNHPSAGQ